jgi:hypothetical protein
VKPNGEIKLGQQEGACCIRVAYTEVANQECCSVVDQSGMCDIKSIGYITMELMQKYAKDDGAIGIENLNRWRMDSDAVKFLSTTTSAGSFAELRRVSTILAWWPVADSLKHPLLNHPWRKEDLELLVELASISVHRVYKYQP